MAAPTAAELLREFLLDPEVAFLNHGSFGACPRPVFERYQAWQRELELEPIDFLDRRAPDLLAAAPGALADYLGCAAKDVAFVENATTGVNLAARSLDLGPDDEVLATDLEYGACDLAWQWVCRRAGARYVRAGRSEEHTSELQSLAYLVCRLLLEKKNTIQFNYTTAQTDYKFE